MDRYVCVHGHFYQPPREHPWFEAVQVQDSAYPYHDWNERVAYECYAPNAASRILDRDGLVAEIVNNYAKISFNFGATLLSWLEPSMPSVYEAILAADRESRKRFGGHGSAMAQSYNHMIMPLASERDRRTQIAWGIRDFSRRFGRLPEGMWLPETAVDTPTLEAMAERGIKFTVLAPRQAGRVRPPGATRWQDVSGERIDTRRPYLQRLPSGKSIALFFYDGPAARAVAFEGLLHDGEALAGRLLGGFDRNRLEPQLSHIATDGETYGHHHRHGDMALAFAMKRIEESGEAKLTVYGEYLDRHPPTHEVEIVENSSWSCEHGVERWRADCGCRAGRHPGWRQGWRGPLRTALDWLRDEVAGPYETEAAAVFDDPWQARDDYIEVILDRSPDRLGRFLEEHGGRRRTGRSAERTLKLLELQRHAMLMYTSCGWFFEEISGIETIQVMQYAARVIQLAEDLFESRLEPGFLARLEPATGNVPEYGDGRSVFVRWARPAEVGLLDVAAHHAASSLFEDPGKRSSIYDYDVDRTDFESKEDGKARLAVGRVTVTSRVTSESMTAMFGAIHSGDLNGAAGVREYGDPSAYQSARSEMMDAFDMADFPAVTRALERHFGHPTRLVNALFRDERRRVIDRALEKSVTAPGGIIATEYDREAPLMRYLVSLGSPLPKPFQSAAELYLNASLRQALSAEGDLNPDRLRALADDAAQLGVQIDREGLAYRLAARVRKAMCDLEEAPADLRALNAAARYVSAARGLPFPIDMSEAQRTFARLHTTALPRQQRAAGAGDLDARRWVDQFTALGRQLSMPAS